MSLNLFSANGSLGNGDANAFLNCVIVFVGRETEKGLVSLSLGEIMFWSRELVWNFSISKESRMVLEIFSIESTS